MLLNLLSLGDDVTVEDANTGLAVAGCVTRIDAGRAQVAGRWWVHPGDRLLRHTIGKTK